MGLRVKLTGLESHRLQYLKNAENRAPVAAQIAPILESLTFPLQVDLIWDKRWYIHLSPDRPSDELWSLLYFTFI